MCVRHPGSLVAEGEQLVEVAAIERLARPAVELLRPFGGHRLAQEGVVDERQPVGQEPAADDEHAFVAHRREASADLEEMLPIEVGHRHLRTGMFASGYIALPTSPSVLDAGRMLVIYPRRARRAEGGERI